MKKFIFKSASVFMMAVAAICFTACGSDDEKRNPENENVVTNSSEDKKTNDESDNYKEDNSNDNKSDDTSDTPAQDAVEAIQLWADGPKWGKMAGVFLIKAASVTIGHHPYKALTLQHINCFYILPMLG